MVSVQELSMSSMPRNLISVCSCAQREIKHKPELISVEAALVLSFSKLNYYSHHVGPWTWTSPFEVYVMQKCFVSKLNDIEDNINVQSCNIFAMNIDDAI